jgi:uncharacterized membrane protein YgaE (UPF0421/DUF939 family)
VSVVPRIRTRSRLPILQVLKTALSAVLAWTIAITLLPQQLPVFAAVAALLVVQPSINQSFGKALERTLGVITGVIVATIIGLVFGDNAWIVLLAIVLSILLAWVLRLGPGAANQIPISAMLVLSIGAATPDYSFARILETLIGAAVGLIVNALIVPPVLLAPAKQAVADLAIACADALDRLADALRSEQTGTSLTDLLTRARTLRPMRDKAAEAISQGQDSLMLNPRRSRHRDELEHQQALLERLQPIVTRTLGMTRTFHDHYDETLHDEATVEAIATELHRASHDLRLLVADAPPTDHTPATAEIPALTAPLIIRKPHPEHWILIGSLMEDLRRIRNEIVDDGDESSAAERP